MQLPTKSYFINSTILLLLPLLWLGCASAPKPPAPLDSVQVSGAATELIGRLLEKGALDRVPNPPAKVRLLPVVNNTKEHFDVSLFGNKIQVALNESTKASIVMNPAMPVDYILSGKIISMYLRTNERRDRTYTFQLTLSDPQGTVKWVGEKEVKN